MKLGMNMLLWTGHVTMADSPTLARLAAAGFDGVELPVFEGTPEHFQTLGLEIRRLGLDCTTVAIATPEASPISPVAAVRAAARDHLRRCIERSHAVGARTMVGPFHSALGQFSGQGPTPSEQGWAAEVLRDAAEFACSAGITLAIEYLNRFECYFLTTAQETAALVRAVNHPNFLAMYDTFHAHIEERSQPQAIQTLAPYLAHVHVSENHRGIPGSGQVDWAGALRSLREAGYDGWLVIEAFGRALPSLAAATRVWRDFFAHPDDVWLQGGAFIRALWTVAGQIRQSGQTQSVATPKPA